MRPSYKKYVRSERERFQREGLDITYPKQRKQEIVYRERIKEIPKVVVREKIVYVDKPLIRNKQPEGVIPSEKEQIQKSAQEPYKVSER